MNRLKLKSSSIYRSVSAFVLALFMMLSGTLVSYAAEVPGKNEAYKQLSSLYPDSEFSSFYIKTEYSFIPGRGYTEACTYSFVSADTAEGLFCYDWKYDYDGLDLLFGRYTDGVIEELYKKFHYSVTYVLTDGSLLNFASGSSDELLLKNNSVFCQEFYSIETNIPYFASLESAMAYYDFGDMSGLKNPDAFGLSLYDSSVEVPLNLRVDMDSIFKFCLGGYIDRKNNVSDPKCVFTWDQSEDILVAAESENFSYKTEIYMQQTFEHRNGVFGSPSYRLTPSELIGTIDIVGVSSSFSFNLPSLEKLRDKWSDMGYGTTSLVNIEDPVFPCYFYLRNVCGNKHSNWVRVTVNENNITVNNASTGSFTVTCGYDEIDGNVSIPGADGILKGDTVSDSRYGNKYSIDVDLKNADSLIKSFRNGFGLLGDNGLIPLIGAFFSFVPEQYFSVLITFVSSAALVSLFLIFLRR